MSLILPIVIGVALAAVAVSTSNLLPLLPGKTPGYTDQNGITWEVHSPSELTTDPNPKWIAFDRSGAYGKKNFAIQDSTRANLEQSIRDFAAKGLSYTSTNGRHGGRPHTSIVRGRQLHTTR